jgi:hypothetical protein
MTTGLEENFGILKDNNFDNNNLSNIFNIKPLENGNEYKFIIEAKFRKPDTLFESLEEEKTNYVYKPNKWLNPIILEKGSLNTEKTRKSYYSENEFELGATLSIIEKNVHFGNIQDIFSIQQIEKIKQNIVKIYYNINGNNLNIDRINIYNIDNSLLKHIDISDNQNYFYVSNVENKIKIEVISNNNEIIFVKEVEI